MQHDSRTLPPHLAVLFEQIAATEARIAQLDRELAEIRAGRLLDLPHRSVLDADGEDARPRLRVVATSPSGEEGDALIARSTPQRGLRPLRQPSRPAKKHHHSHRRGH